MTKKGIIFETLGKVNDLSILESNNDGSVRMSGVFGVCGIRNGNNRVYEKSNYGKMVNILKEQIQNEAVLGELEHPNTMNITLENVSHMIEDINMNEDGTVTGTIKLLNTPKGKIAKAIVEGGAPLYISSRGAGSIDENGNVQLSTIRTYDLVGTPGFSQAKLQLTGNQKFEALNESLGIIYEAEDLLGGGSDDEDKDKKSEEEKDPKEEKKPKDTSEDKKSEEEKDPKEDKKSSDDEKSEEKKEEPKEDKKEKSSKKETNDSTMNDIAKKIDDLSKKVEELEASLHIAQDTNESLSNDINYDAIEKWIKEEYTPVLEAKFEDKLNEASQTITENFTTILKEGYADAVQEWVVEQFTPEVQGWIVEHFTPEVQNWLNEEYMKQYSENIEKWITEEFKNDFANEMKESLQQYITENVFEKYSNCVQEWVTEELAPTIQGWVTDVAIKENNDNLEKWITEEFAPEYSNKLTSDVSEFIESQKEDKMTSIDNMLEALSDKAKASETTKQIIKEQIRESKYAGCYPIDNMPANLRPLFESLSDEKQQEIVRSAKLYDFTRPNVLENFWAAQNLTPEMIAESFAKKDVKTLNERKYEDIFAKAKAMRP